MSDKRKTVLMRFARTLAATVVGMLAVWAAGPDAADLIGDNTTAQALMVGVVVPLLVAADKALRYGNDPGEEA